MVMRYIPLIVFTSLFGCDLSDETKSLSNVDVSSIKDNPSLLSLDGTTSSISSLISEDSDGDQIPDI